MNSLNHIARMNSAAASCYHQGELAAAHSILISALRQLRASCDCCNNIHTDVGKGNFPASSGIYYVEPPGDDLPLHIFDGAFLVTDDVPYTNWSVATILLFNLGIFHHQDGLKSGSSISMQKALSFYEKSLRLLDELSGSTSLTLMLAALYNNMKSIYETFFLRSKARQMSSNLSELLHWMQSHSSVSEEVIGFFRASLFFSSVTTVSAAPAA